MSSSMRGPAMRGCDVCRLITRIVLALAVAASTQGLAGAVELRRGDILLSGVTYDENGDEVAAIVHVDSVTRNRTYLSGAGIGNGPALGGPAGIAILGDSTILVADAGTSSILRIDPATGDRTVLSGPSAGNGALIGSPHGIWPQDDDSLLMVDRANKSVFSVDLTSGDRTIVSSSTRGTGPQLVRPYDVTTTLDGRILVASYPATPVEDE